ncbi:MAG TPA: alpha/beta hydrolase-fold protein [Roseiflexaceae bacterium]|nr:alpha/beta hydrolase-fold protein [Roseiflexaceae bacterium]
MSSRYHAQSLAVGLLIVALLTGCQVARNAPVSQATVPTTTFPTQAVAETTALPVTPAVAAAATAVSTQTPARYSTQFIPAPSLRGNQIGEKDQRVIGVYLPPSYFTSDSRYPVVYYLPGFTDSSMLGFNLPGEADKLVRSGAMRELIIVVANGANQLGGSFYVNSPATGRWEDFIVDDVVGYVDSHYRTVAQASARAISGHSMGGFGALNIAMHHPDVFSVVYSLSPGLFDPNGLAESQMFELDGYIKRFLAYEQRIEALPVEKARRAMLSSPDDFTLAYGLAFAPNPAKHPPYLDYPYAQVGGELVRDAAIWKTWDAGFGGIPEKIQQYKANLTRLNGLVVDYGRQDEYAWIPKGCAYFGAQLTAAGIPHELRSYDGGHENRLGERISKYMLPFLSDRLNVD